MSFIKIKQQTKFDINKIIFLIMGEGGGQGGDIQ